MESAVVQKIKHLPKVELHVHLDTSLSYEMVRRIHPRISFAEYTAQYTVPDKCKSLSHFLTYVEPGITLLQEEFALRKAMYDLVRQQALDNVIYSEIRLAPLLHTRRGLTLYEVADIVCDAAQEASTAFGFPVRLIFCTMRHFTAAQGIDTARAAVAHIDRGVVGFDLAGAEADYPLQPHLEAFRIAESSTLGLTAHAGEARGAESILETIEQIPVTRIGHGVRVLQSVDTIQKLIDRQIHLEICPISNIKIDVFQQMSDHAVNCLFDKGILLSINTDGWGLFQSTLSKEYTALVETFDWTLDHFLQINQMAVDAAFTDEATKLQLHQKLLDGYRNAEI
jgi:adenosine deaminase